MGRTASKLQPCGGMIPVSRVFLPERFFMSANHIELHRVLRAPPERVYAAFVQPEAWAKWLPPHGFTARVHSMDPRPGGRYQMAFTHLGTGHSHSFGGEYLELVPGRLLRYTAVFDDPHLPGCMQTTVTLQPVSCGVALHVRQEGIPPAIPLEACHLGWQESLQLLTLLVEQPDMRN